MVCLSVSYVVMLESLKQNLSTRASTIQALLGIILLTLPFERIPSYNLAAAGVELTIRISQVAGVLFILLCLPDMWNRRKGLIKSPWLWLVLFNLVSLLSALQAINTRRAILVFSFVLFVSLLSFAISLAAKSSLVNRYQVWLFLGTVIALIFGIYQFFGDLANLPVGLTGLQEQYTKLVFGFPRIQSTALEPLYFADYLLIPASLLAAITLFKNRVGAAYVLLLLGCLTTIWLTVSRGAFLGIAVIMISALFVGVIKKRYKRSAALILIIAASVGLSFSLIFIGSVKQQKAESNIESFSHQSTNVSYGESFEGRATTRQLAVGAFKQNILLGVGPGNFGHYAHNQMPSKFAGSKSIVNNEPLEILAEVGVLGMALISLFVISIYYNAAIFLIRNNSAETKIWVFGLLLALTGIAAQYQTFSTLYITHIWVAVGLLIGAVGATKRN